MVSTGNLDHTSIYLHSGDTWLFPLYGQQRQGKNSNKEQERENTDTTQKSPKISSFEPPSSQGT